MKILIIGGSGVISEYLTAITSKMHMDVYCYCRGNSKELIPDNVNIIFGDCFNKEELTKKLGQYSFDVVIDFMSFNGSQLNIKLNSLKGKTTQYIFISSAVIYSESKDLVEKKEEDDKNNDLWGYSIGKIECERLLIDFCSQNDMKYTIVRPYITYGNQRVPFQINSFLNSFSIINRIILGKPIVIAGNGNNQSTITHSEDLCRALVGLILNPKAFNNDFNITSDETFTWNQVLGIIGKVVGIKPIPVYLPVEFVEENSPLLKGSIAGDKARNMLFDNTKIKEVLEDDNLFQIKFEDGIKKTYHFMKNTFKVYKTDMEWDKEIDGLIEKYNEKGPAADTIQYSGERTQNSNIELYRCNYLSLEKKYYDLEKIFNWLNRITSLDNALETFEKYFQKEHINSIAIYGIGNMGKKFYKIVKESSKISIGYIIDMNVKDYETMKICNLDDALGKVDAIIVTPITSFNEIRHQILGKCNYRIISMEEIID